MPITTRTTATDRTRALGLATIVLGAILLLTGAGAAAGAPEGPDPVGVWPLSPVPAVVAAFDPPDSTYGAGHRGVDLAGRAGQAVRAALPGTVTFAGSLAGRGVVVVDHGTTRTTYEPVTATAAIGATVARGAPVGVLQLPGSHCFPRACLHWGWIEGETYLDPLRLVGMGPVRLLPLGGLGTSAAPLPRPTAMAALVTPVVALVALLQVLGH